MRKTNQNSNNVKVIDKTKYYKRWTVLEPEVTVIDTIRNYATKNGVTIRRAFITDGATFESLMKLSVVMDELKKEGKYKEIEIQIDSVKLEIIARWANIIYEISKYEQD